MTQGIKKLKAMIRHPILWLCCCMLCVALAAVISIYFGQFRDIHRLDEQQNRLKAMKEEAVRQPAALPSKEDIPQPEEGLSDEPAAFPAVMLDEYRAMYAENNYLIGWLTIDDTVIDYPVVQTPEDEEYYLYLDFAGEENKNGTLIMDTDSCVGVGTKEQAYTYLDDQGTVCVTPPSSNLIIHGHTMKFGQMFGDLKKFQKEAYGEKHHLIRFDSLYEHREYELISVFYTRVFYEDEDVFKFYKFFQADTQEEFDDWYQNIKKMALYDTGVTAEFGDEFITLSSCAYHVSNGRFVVVGKRIR